MRVEVIPARREHVADVAAHMRADDREEVWAWSMADPETALLRSLAGSALCWTGTIDDAPAAMFGVGAPTLLSVEAVPWFLGTDALDRIPARMARMSREWVRRMQVFPVLANWSDARHERAHAWLRWLGFDIGIPISAGALGLPFRPFAMRCADV